MHPFFIWFLSLCFLPIAKSCQIDQSKKFSLLSQLALSSQNKFFLKSPPKSRKKVKAGQAAGSPDADLVAELDGEAETSEALSPIGQYEPCLSAGLDCAISDLVSLDSQAEVDQGIFLPLREINVRLQLFSVLCSLLCQNPSRKPLFPLFFTFKFKGDLRQSLPLMISPWLSSFSYWHKWSYLCLPSCVCYFICWWYQCLIQTLKFWWMQLTQRCVML